MEGTPKIAIDSGYDSTSTPIFPKDDTPILGARRKRKASASYYENAVKSISVMECSPQFSSTLNDSLLKPFESVRLYDEKETSSGFCSVPNTPEHQVKYSRDTTPKRAHTSGFIKHFSQIGIQNQSPLKKEAYNILYPELPSLEPIKRVSTPLKIDKTPYRPRQRQSSLDQILTNPLIMRKILRQLSNGDLFRLSKVSMRFKSSILNDTESWNRLSEYRVFHKLNRENYRITPPNSPEKDEEVDLEASPSSKNFNTFLKMAQSLNKNQSMIKCPKCDQPSIVENDIAQCQNLNGCGYIFCRKCDSFAYKPKDFKNKCNKAQLLNKTNFRSLLGDLSNSALATSDYGTAESSSFFLSSSFKSDLSACVVSTPKQSVKRNLSKSFSCRKFQSFNNNRTPIKKRSPIRTSLVPVVPQNVKEVDVTVPSSPISTSTKSTIVCSKQSKKNLKRLTF